ncbi:beta-2-microglobulin [Discoglossus pictus]
MRSLCVVVLGVLLSLAQAGEYKAPVVNVYTAKPIEYGESSIVICNCESFFPPNLLLTLKKNGQEMSNVQKSDMAFKNDWTYKFMNYVETKIDKNDKIECVVEHNGLPPKIYQLQHEF